MLTTVSVTKGVGVQPRGGCADDRTRRELEKLLTEGREERRPSRCNERLTFMVILRNKDWIWESRKEKECLRNGVGR